MKNMENKYFIPAIEDVKLNYEFEFCSLINPHTPEWVPMKLIKDNPYRFEDSKGIIETMEGNIKKGYIRVPCLTKEQIEAEGWNVIDDKGMSETYGNLFMKSINRNGDFPFICKIQYWYSNKRIKIVNQHLGCMFEGECKDINTFRTICKLLKIN